MINLWVFCATIILSVIIMIISIIIIINNINKKKISVLTINLFAFSLSYFIISNVCILVNKSNKKVNEELHKEIVEEYENIWSIDENSVENINVNIYNTNIQNEKNISFTNNKKVIGKIEIPVINLSYPILNETTEELMKIAPTKYSGPRPNGIGNLVIIGHNYYDNTQFSGLFKLKNGDKVYITDISGMKVEYEVFEIKVIEPNDFSCTKSSEEVKSFVTLITCCNGIKNRYVVKCVESEFI